MNIPKELTTVTPLSKALAIILFISLPFIGFFLGIKYQSSLNTTRVEIIPSPIPSLVIQPTNIPTITVPETTGKNDVMFISRSLEELISRIKTLCANKNYQNIALNSLKYENDNYQLINDSDITEKNQDLSYLDSAMSLCYTIESNASIDKKKLSDTEWQYRYIFGPSNNSAYSLIFYQGSWKFILHKLARL